MDETKSPHHLNKRRPSYDRNDFNRAMYHQSIINKDNASTTTTTITTTTSTAAATTKTTETTETTATITLPNIAGFSSQLSLNRSVVCNDNGPDETSGRDITEQFLFRSRKTLDVEGNEIGEQKE